MCSSAWTILHSLLEATLQTLTCQPRLLVVPLLIVVSHPHWRSGVVASEMQQQQVAKLLSLWVGDIVCDIV